MNELDTHYATGEPIRIGDRVSVGDWIGVVVFVIGTNQYAEGFDSDWAYLGRGFMVDYDKAGLVFAEEADEEVLLSRA